MILAHPSGPMFFEVSENPAYLAGGLIALGEGSARVCVAANAHGGPFCAVPEGQDGVKAYRGTVSLARLFHEALVGRSVGRALRVEFVSHPVVLGYKLFIRTKQTIPAQAQREPARAQAP